MNKTSKIILSVSIILILGLGALIYFQFSKITEAENQLVELTQVMEFEKQQSIEEYEKLQATIKLINELNSAEEKSNKHGWIQFDEVIKKLNIKDE